MDDADGYTIKIMLLGDVSVGKSSILNHYLEKGFKIHAIFENFFNISMADLRDMQI